MSATDPIEQPFSVNLIINALQIYNIFAKKRSIRVSICGLGAKTICLPQNLE